LEERVLVIAKEILIANNSFNLGIREIPESQVLDLINKYGKFMDRDLAEQDYNYLQIIPYVVIQKEDKYFCTKRTKKQSEARLHEKLSIGVGGHLNDSDGDLNKIVASGMKRELEEELYPFSSFDQQFIGLLIDQTQDVSLVHAGLVYRLKTSDEVRIQETGKMSGSFMSLIELMQTSNFSKLESWSQIVLSYLKIKKN
jgi:predicted NUDIX family phosphoesterase